MIKKIVLVVLLFVLSFSNLSVFAAPAELQFNKNGTVTVIGNAEKYGYEKGAVISGEQAGDIVGCSTGGDCSMFDKSSGSDVGTAGGDTAGGGGVTKQNDGTTCFDGDCTVTENNTISTCSGPDCLSSTDFKIDTTTISPGGNMAKDKTGFANKANFVLGTFIQKMLIGIGTLALFTMSIGAGYMIFYHGHDEYLSKGKTIFTTGITALIIALSSYYLVSLVRYILYSN